MSWVGTNPLVQKSRAADPSTVAGAGQWYPKTVSSLVEAFYVDSSGNVTQITSAGKINAGELGGSPVFDSLVVTEVIKTSGSPTAVTVTGAAHTTLTASAEAPTILFDASATVEFATGALTSQRAFKFLAPTYGFVGASTLTTAATLYVDAAPTAGTNATLTTTHALWVDAGSSRFDGPILGSDGSKSAPAFSFLNNSDTGIFNRGPTVSIALSGGDRFELNGFSMTFMQDVTVDWAGGTTFGTAIDITLSRGAANHLHLGSGDSFSIGDVAIAAGTNVLQVANGTAPTSATANSVVFYSSDDAAGHTIPSFYCEGTNVIATSQADSVSSVRVKARFNGTAVTLLCI